MLESLRKDDWKTRRLTSSYVLASFSDIPGGASVTAGLSYRFGIFRRYFVSSERNGDTVFREFGDIRGAEEQFRKCIAESIGSPGTVSPYTGRSVLSETDRRCRKEQWGRLLSYSGGVLLAVSCAAAVTAVCMWARFAEFCFCSGLASSSAGAWELLVSVLSRGG